jgi:hypothetical protein
MPNLRVSRKDTGCAMARAQNALASARYNHKPRYCKVLKILLPQGALPSNKNTQNRNFLATATSGWPHIMGLAARRALL